MGSEPIDSELLGRMCADPAAFELSRPARGARRSGSVLGVTGLDNAAPVLPLIKQRVSAQARHGTDAAKAQTPCSDYYGQYVTPAGALPKRLGVTSFATSNCGYDAAQIRSAYGATAARSSGRCPTSVLSPIRRPGSTKVP
jgi:hypothetical protein